jgi:hypothetical protein
LLKLHDLSQFAVLENDEEHRFILSGWGDQFETRHQECAIAHNANHLLVGFVAFGANAAEPHRGVIGSLRPAEQLTARFCGKPRLAPGWLVKRQFQLCLAIMLNQKL